MRKKSKLNNIKQANIKQANISAEQRYLESKGVIVENKNPNISLDVAFDNWLDGTLKRLSVDDIISLHNELWDYAYSQGYDSIYGFLTKSEDAYVNFAKKVIAPKVKRNKKIFNDVMVATYEKF